MPSAGNIFIDIALNVAHIQKDFAKATDTLKQFQQNAERVGSALKTTFKFAGAAAGLAGVGLSVKGLTGALKDLADRGERAGDLAAGFERLGGTASTIEQARTRTLGLVNSFELMRIASRGMTAEIPGFEKGFAGVAELGARLADTWGTDTTEAINKVVSALSTAKAGSLEQIGFVVDTKKAYDEYAKSLRITADQLTETEKKHARQGQAMAQVPGVLQRLAAVTDSSSTALTSLANSWNEVIDKTGQVLNDNPQLVRELRELEKVVREIDLASFAKNIAELSASLIGLANSALPTTVKLLNQVSSAISGIKAARDQLGIKTGNPLVDLSVGAGYAYMNPEDVVSGMTENRLKDTLARINEGQAKLNQSEKDLGSMLDILGGTGKGGTTLPPKPKDNCTSVSPAELKRMADEAARAKEEVKRLAEEFAKMQDTQLGRSLADQIDVAIGSLDQQAFSNLTAQFEKHTFEGVRKGLEESVKRGAITSAQADAYATEEAARAIESYQDQMSEAIADNAKEIEEAHKKAYEESVDFWRDTFSKVINGEGFNLEDMFKDIAVGFAAEFMAQMTKGMSGANFLQNPANFGGLLAQMFMGGASAAGGGGGGMGGGTTTTTAGAIASLSDYYFAGSRAGDMQGPLTQSGQAMHDAGMGRNTSMALGDTAATVGSAATGMAAAYGYAQLADSLMKAGKGAKSNYIAGMSTAGAVVGGAIAAIFSAGTGTAAGAGIGAAFGNVLGKMSSKWFGIGTSHPDTMARKAAANEIETIFDQVSAEGGIRFINERGQVNLATDIVDQPFSHFNQFDPQRDLFGKYGQQTSTAFLGVGAGLAEEMGMGAQGGQLGVMLAESFQGSLEGLKAFVQAIGLTYEQLTDTLVKRGKMGRESWLAIVSQINDAAAAFQEGLAGTGKWDEALGNLAKSAGTGQLALNQLKNVAIEAGEVGITSVSQLQAQRDAIIESGKMTAQEFDALILSLQQHGITNLGDILELDDLGLGRIIAGMDANLQNMGQTWRDVSGEVQAFQDAVNGIDGREVNVAINVTSNVDENTQAMMDAGILPELPNGETSTTVPPASALDTANTASTRLLNTASLRMATDGGSHRGVQLNIDARGAGNGVAEQIVQSLSTIEDRIQTNTLDAVLRYMEVG